MNRFLVIFQRRGFVGNGFYYFLQLRNDSAYNTAGFFRFMRVDLGMSKFFFLITLHNDSSGRHSGNF